MRKIYSEYEINFIKEKYKTLGVTKISKILDRTICSISNKAKKLGVVKEKYILNSYSEEQIKKAVLISTNVTEVMRNLDLSTRGNNYKTIKKYIKFYNIDITHFLQRDYSNLHSINRKNIDEILIENSSYNSTTNLKNRLYKEGLKVPICEECGQDENWRGKKFSLILDHINGISDDNRLDNLRILCPNCNATLETHCRGNKRLTKKLYDKSIKLEKMIKTKTEFNLNRRKVRDRPSVETLLNEVKELGYTAVGKKYGVKDNCIRKWLGKENVIKFNKPRRPEKPKCIDCGKEVSYSSKDRCKNCKSQSSIKYLLPKDEYLTSFIIDSKEHGETWCSRKYNVDRSVIRRWIKEYKKLIN